MEMNRTKAAGLLLLLVCLFACQPSAAQSKPRWAQKGEKSLNHERSNDNYQFKVFNTYGMDVDRLHAERFNPLLTHVREQYGVAPDAIRLDSIYSGVDPVVTYRIVFPEGENESVVYARRVDEYCAYEDYVDNTYQFEYYQLYAITEKNQLPDVFDDFELTRSYNSRAAALSIVPGLGQLYKGQSGKGYFIMGAEAVLVASAIVFSVKKHYCDNMMDEQPEVRDSWRSKSHGWRDMRNICIGLAGGLYIYNLIDAAVAKGARQVIVKKPQGRQLTVAPVATFDGAGVSFVLNF